MDKSIYTYFLFNDEFKISSEFENYNTSIGKSLYEVIRISDGIPIFLMEHIKRLENSAKIMKYNLNISSNEIINRIVKLIFKNSVCDGNMKLVINDNFLAYFVPYNYPSKQEYAEGVKTITFHGERSNPNAKVINSVFREKVNEQINNENAYEAILVDDAGFITEGSKSNIFLVQGSTVVTSKVINVLPGITREFVIKTCEKLNIVFQEKNIHESDLESYDGLFISGTSPKVLPIKSVDGFYYNSSKNKIINSIMSEFDAEFNKDKQKFVKFTQSRTINK
ncbi:aminotransferase class IV [Clostridium sp.]|uniref:aminotransferase class IV n=1 Tax=Clostridium sp. TaxID=1506 RepID=UPI001A57D6A3|nr:aminotransferase class IV [Clostridium sp.]MBK5234285.1 aminotransferase class IV [Clostridium sp.]